MKLLIVHRNLQKFKCHWGLGEFVRVIAPQVPMVVPSLITDQEYSMGVLGGAGLDLQSIEYWQNEYRGGTSFTAYSKIFFFFPAIVYLLKALANC